MNIIITVADTKITDVRTALVLGTAKVHSEREDGTLRRRHFLAPDTKAREEAEWVSLQRRGQEADEDGTPAVTPRTMASIAKELNLSVAAVRRMLVDLLITQEIEESEDEELAELVTGWEQEEAK